MRRKIIKFIRLKIRKSESGRNVKRNEVMIYGNKVVVVIGNPRNQESVHKENSNLFRLLEIVFVKKKCVA